jgi:hypothetical protein
LISTYLAATIGEDVGLPRVPMEVGEQHNLNKKARHRDGEDRK